MNTFKNSSGHILINYSEAGDREAIRHQVKSKLSLKGLSLRKHLKYSKAELLEMHEEDDLEQALKVLNSHPHVHYAQPNYRLFPCGFEDNENFRKQWGLHNEGQPNQFGNAGRPGMDIQVLPAWEITKGSPSVLVAVIDTGVDIQHRDLFKNIYCNPSEADADGRDSDGNGYIDDVSGWDFVDRDHTVYDAIAECKHGTQVAGVIAAGCLESGVQGVAPGVKILPLKIMDARHGDTAAAIEAIEYAKLKGVRIANCSWGDYTYNEALKFHMENADILFICAAGNDGENCLKKPFYPACFDLPNVISVSAVCNTGEVWEQSNYGKNIHLAAPGTCILSTIPSIDEESYGVDSGTSMAAPFVTGVAALILSEYGDLSKSEIKKKILSSVSCHPQLKRKVGSGGLVNAYGALRKE